MSIQEEAPAQNLDSVVYRRADIFDKEQELVEDVSVTSLDSYRVVVEDGERNEEILVPSSADLASLLEVERTRNGKLTDDTQYEPAGISRGSEDYDAILAYESLIEGDDSTKDIKVERI